MTDPGDPRAATSAQAPLRRALLGSLSGAAAALLVASCLGSSGRPWFGLLCFAPFLSFPLRAALPARAAGTAAIAAAALAGFFATSTADPGRFDLPLVLGPLLCGVAVSVITGHVAHVYSCQKIARPALLEERSPPAVSQPPAPQPPAPSLIPPEDAGADSAELRQLLRRADQLREDERAAVARELHDELGQLLTGLRIELDMAELVRARGGDVQAEHERLGHLLDATLESTRSILTHLRPQILEDFGLVAALSWLASDTQRRAGIAVHFSSDAEDVQVSPEVATCVFRVVQESLTNVLRHARARRVRIDLALAGEDCVVRVADDGVGIPPGLTRRSTSMGVLGMRERARSLGGTFELRSPPEGGALVTVRLPARPAAPTQECA